jgi:hypothetical protein
MTRTLGAVFAGALVTLLLIGAAIGRATPRELGEVRWERDLDAALERSAGDGKPLFVLFQEVPGCSTCVSFGEQVLSQALLVHAVETEFHPVFVYNNRPGRDAEILKRFDEPAWNNPVVRLLDAAGKDLVPRRTGVWTVRAMAERMVRALEAAHREAPGYLRELAEVTQARIHERATFGMYCYWSGEACLGGIPGILSSRTGHLGGSEVVEVVFDLEVTSYAALVAAARRRGCAERVFAHSAAQVDVARTEFAGAVQLERRPLREASSRDQKYYLRRSPLRRLELTPQQQLRVNAALAAGEDPSVHLTPRQETSPGD